MELWLSILGDSIWTQKIKEIITILEVIEQLVKFTQIKIEYRKNISISIFIFKKYSNTPLDSHTPIMSKFNYIRKNYPNSKLLFFKTCIEYIRYWSRFKRPFR